MSKSVVTGNGIKWYQAFVTIPAKSRGIHKVTDHFKALPLLKKIKIGTMNIFLQHTSASITLNECWDNDVRQDMEMMLNRIAPENAPYKHTIEGVDDMPAHVKCSLMGASLTIPITNGELNMGTWQGIWLCEHRNHASARNIVVTVQGCE